MIVAVWFMLAGLKGLVVGIGAALAYRRLTGQFAEHWYASMALTASIYVAAAALPRIAVGGLYLMWKRFNSFWIAAMCLIDGLFWSLLALDDRAPVVAVLAVLTFGALHFAAAFVFLHPSVRRRHAEAAA